jgi:hypothetical protein
MPLVELRGVDHGPWMGNDEQVLTAVEAFVPRLADHTASPQGCGKAYQVT